MTVSKTISFREKTYEAISVYCKRELASGRKLNFSEAVDELIKKGIIEVCT